MKTLKNILVFAVLFIASSAFAQTNKATTQKVVEAKDFIFNATSALPMSNNDVSAILSRMPGGQGGGMIQLTGSQYQLVVNTDSVEAYLPFYGRTYVASRDPNDSGIKFKSKDFSYKSEKKKKGNWVITIKPKDSKDAQTLTLNVSENGYASLNVNSNNRQSITFNGYILEPKEGKK